MKDGGCMRTQGRTNKRGVINPTVGSSPTSLAKLVNTPRVPTRPSS